MNLPEDVLLRLAVATVLGAIVGLERERAEQAAGLRTHALVSLGAALFMIVSTYGFSSVLGTHVVLDPSRVAAQVASGIGFLGAGTIILRRQIVRGLTTAASIWTVAAIGLATGCGMYVAAASATLFVLIVLAAMRPLEGLLFGWRRSVRFVMVCDAERFPAAEVRQLLTDAGATLENLEVRLDNEKQRDRADLLLRRGHMQPLRIAAALRALPGVREVRTVIVGPLQEGQPPARPN